MKTETTECTELVQIEKAVEACNAVAVSNPVREALVWDLGPVANRLAQYAAAAEMSVTNNVDAEGAARLCEKIAADIKTVKDHEVLSKITAGLHNLHRQWTGLRDLFVAPMERDRRTIKNKVIAWQEGERRKAEEIQRKAQAEADAKAAREREALLKKAASVKTPEKQEAYREAAAAIIPPTIHVAAPKSGLRTQTVWIGEVVDPLAAARALLNFADWSAYIKIDQNELNKFASRTKGAVKVPGVNFKQVTR